MENVLLISTSRQMALRREMDVIANNIANVTTNGFKRRLMETREYQMPVASEDGFNKPDRKVSFTIEQGTVLDTATGSLEPTGNPLDVALSADSYFTVRTPQGDRYTRNGAMMLNVNGELVNSDGHALLGEQGAFQFGSEETGITVAADGTVMTANGPRGKLRLVSFANQQSLENTGANLFTSTETPSAARNVRAQVGYVERSNVSPVLEMSRMIEVNRQYQNIANMISRGDEVRRNAIQKLGEPI
jgi:flagellar basal-body rod protein FlgF